MPNHQRTTSIPQARLTQSLPPLPQNESIPQIPYHDDPADDEVEEVVEQNEVEPTNSNEPPQYEPMHDYLASRVRRLAEMRPPNYLSSAAEDYSQNIPLQIQEPYRDDPFIITIDPNQPPPPSYETLYIEQTDLERLQQDIDLDTNHAEDICKWLVSMVLIALTIVAAGFAFNWGKPF